MKRRKDSEPNRTPGTRPPEYVIVVAASDWVKERYPDDRFNLWDALDAGKDPDPEPQPDPEPDLEQRPNHDPPPASPGRAHRRPGMAGDAMKRRKDSEPSRVPGTRPPNT